MVFATAAPARGAFFAVFVVAVFRTGDFFAAVFPETDPGTTRFATAAGDVPACFLAAFVDALDLFAPVFVAVAISVGAFVDALRLGLAPPALSSSTHVGAWSLAPGWPRTQRSTPASRSIGAS